MLKYSFKRVSTYIPKDNFSPHRTRKRIMFIKNYLKTIQDPDSKVFVLDEVGFGTSHLRNYSYSIIGKPALLWNK